MAAIAGVRIPALSPCRISAANTRKKLGTSARMSAEKQIMPIPLPAKARFHRSAEHDERKQPAEWNLTLASDVSS